MLMVQQDRFRAMEQTLLILLFKLGLLGITETQRAATAT